MNGSEYLYIESTTQRSADLTARSRTEATKWLCPGRYHVRPQQEPMSVELWSCRLGPSALNLITLFGIGLVRKALLQDVGMDLVERYLLLGSVSDRHGALSEEWVTYQGKHFVAVRSIEDSRSRVCEHCGREFAMSGKRGSYLAPPPDPTVGIFDNVGVGLVFRSDVVAHVDFSRYKGIRIQKLKVLDAPIHTPPAA